MNFENKTKIFSLSRGDRRKMDAENQDELLENRYKKEYENLVSDLKPAIEDYFPELASFSEFANYDDFVLQYSQNFLGEHLLESDVKESEQTNAFLAAVAIRYIDNFIDKVLWPEIPNFDPSTLEKLYNGFLERAYVIAHVYDASMPKEILELPRLELSLELHPTQDMFDKHIEELIKRKSFDILYVTRLKMKDKKFGEEDSDKYMYKALNDHARDFSYLNIGPYTPDFSLANFVSDNNIDPGTLIKLMDNVLQKNGYSCTKIKKENEDQDQDLLYDWIHDGEGGHSELNDMYNFLQEMHLKNSKRKDVSMSETAKMLAEMVNKN